MYSVSQLSPSVRDAILASIACFNVLLLRGLDVWTWIGVDAVEVLKIVVAWSVGDGNWKWINERLSQHTRQEQV